MAALFPVESQSQYTFRQVYFTDPIIASNTGVVTYDLPTPWSVQPGDCPGWYHSGSGTLFFNSGGDVVVWQYAAAGDTGNNAADPGVGGIKNFGSGQ